MITLKDWQSIKWEDRIKLIKAFKMGRSGATKVVQTGPGVCVIEDDGVREQDLLMFENHTVETALATVNGVSLNDKEKEALKVLTQTEKPQEAEEVSETKQVKKTRTKKTK